MGNKIEGFEKLQKEEQRLFSEEDKTLSSGLALSGGGIRSASLSLGMMQALASKGILEKFKYMSTVSGGGYIGAALTWFLRDPENGTTKEKFPFGKKAVGEKSKVNDDFKHKASALNFFRQHGNYLTPTSRLDAISLGGLVLKSMVIPLIVFLSLLTSVFITLHYKIENYTLFDGLLIIAAGLLGLLLISHLISSLLSFFASLFKISGYKSRIKLQGVLGIVWKLILLFTVIGVLPFVHQQIQWLSHEIGANEDVLWPVLLGVGAFICYLKFKDTQHEKSNTNGGNLTTYVGVFLLLLGLLLSALALSKFICCCFRCCYLTNFTIAGGLLITSLVLGSLVNLNYAGHHRMYRNRLMELFLPNMETVNDGKWAPATDANKFKMSSLVTEQSIQTPYHIINTNIVLQDSDVAKYRNRKGDNFIISPLYCGSDATGWCLSKNYMQNRGGMTLATGMAVSAAALNPNAGGSGEGITTNRFVSVLLSLLNLRTGFWAAHPTRNNESKVTPGYFRSLLYALGVFSLKENAKHIELTDGGHFENLGIYELIRRELKVVIVFDGGCDPETNYEDLANAIEKVRVDFGVKIDFGDELNDLEPGSFETKKGSNYRESYKLSKQGFAVGDIYYPTNNDLKEGVDYKEQKGILIYLKSSMIDQLPVDLYSYKTKNSVFPHQSTGDQFFDEKQFEAYRELGFHLTKRMLLNNDLKQRIEKGVYANEVKAFFENWPSFTLANNDEKLANGLH